MLEGPRHTVGGWRCRPILPSPLACSHSSASTLRTIARLHTHAHRRRRHRGSRGDRHGLHPSSDGPSADHRNRADGTCCLRRVSPDPLRAGLLRPRGSQLGRAGQVRSRSGRCGPRAGLIAYAAPPARTTWNGPQISFGTSGAADGRDGKALRSEYGARSPQRPPAAALAPLGELRHGAAVRPRQCGISIDVGSCPRLHFAITLGSPSATSSASRPGS